MTSDLTARFLIFTGAWQSLADLIRQHAILPSPRTLAIAETGTRVENRQINTSAVIVRRRKAARTLNRLTFMSSADLRVNCVRNYIMSSRMASVRYALACRPARRLLSVQSLCSLWLTNLTSSPQRNREHRDCTEKSFLSHNRQTEACRTSFYGADHETIHNEPCLDFDTQLNAAECRSVTNTRSQSNRDTDQERNRNDHHKGDDGKRGRFDSRR